MKEFLLKFKIWSFYFSFISNSSCLMAVTQTTNNIFFMLDGSFKTTIHHVICTRLFVLSQWRYNHTRTYFVWAYGAGINTCKPIHRYRHTHTHTLKLTLSNIWRNFLVHFFKNKIEEKKTLKYLNIHSHINTYIHMYNMHTKNKGNVQFLTTMQVQDNKNIHTSYKLNNNLDKLLLLLLSLLLLPLLINLLLMMTMNEIMRVMRGV